MPILPLGSSPIEPISVISAYRVCDVSSSKHENVYQLNFRALQKNLRFVERRYEWTGAGPPRKPEVLSGIGTDGTITHRLHGDVISDSAGRIYLIDLGRDLAIGETETIRVKETFVDNAGQFQPFLRHFVRQPLGCLELRVSLPPELQQNVRKEIRELATNAMTEPATPLTEQEDSDCFVIRVDKPQVGHSYAIRWLR